MKNVCIHNRFKPSVIAQQFSLVYPRSGKNKGKGTNLCWDSHVSIIITGWMRVQPCRDTQECSRIPRVIPDNAPERHWVPLVIFMTARKCAGSRRLRAPTIILRTLRTRNIFLDSELVHLKLARFRNARIPKHNQKDCSRFRETYTLYIFRSTLASPPPWMFYLAQFEPLTFAWPSTYLFIRTVRYGPAGRPLLLLLYRLLFSGHVFSAFAIP